MKMSIDPQTFQALAWIDNDTIELVQRPFPEIKPGELLVKILAASICGSDLRILRHGNPRVSSGSIIGHEICGEIKKVGQGVRDFSMGDIVSIGADVPCGECAYCNRGRPNNCEVNFAIGHQLSGGFAEYIHLDQRTVALGPIVKTKGDKDPALYALAEPLACCINGFHQFGDISGAKVGIFGAGPIGLMLARLAKFFGASHVVLVDLNGARLRTAKETGFADHTLMFDELLDNSQNQFDVVFTACSSIEAQKVALSSVGTGGKINFFGGLPKGQLPILLDTNMVHYKEILITGSHGSTPAQHKLAVELLDEEKIDLSMLLTESFLLKDYKKAYGAAASGNALKIVFRPHWSNLDV